MWRSRFQKFAGHICLPRFVIQENSGWRQLNCEMDIVSRKLGQKVPWNTLKQEFPDKKVVFQVIYEDEWKNKINEIFSPIKQCA